MIYPYTFKNHGGRHYLRKIVKLKNFKFFVAPPLWSFIDACDSLLLPVGIPDVVVLLRYI